MKVYVNELPKCCAKCPCESDKWCNLMGYVVDEDEYEDERPKQCPLQSLSDYTKQVRKEVCEEIEEQICMLAYKSNTDENFMFNDNVKFNKVLAILDQIQGEDINA